ncbi:M18 family aminopeptidase [Natronoflexus pectinivorans]|uniref:M18 family aminopeptidase n=1 Tax=Natronoflexus pectinivorans TaxID=682526 RepID=A0A4V2RWN5_9BACT|nr:M18 family aminopeptidase [Natronoflexus pectinivorans]TCO09260.1 aspartyl aminopeptidase [Natronoflexus pectinivorans]
MDNAHRLANELIDFIYDGASPFHVVESMAMQLDQAGFEFLDSTTEWELKKGGKYYITPNGSSLFAFVTGTGNPAETGFRIVSAHSDSPTFRLKPTPEMGVDNYYVKLNTEVYGGPILMSWLDRPLSIAGRVSLKSDNPLWPDNRLVNFNRPLVIIPSVAIHLNRAVNDGVAINKQKEMLPLLGILPENDTKDGLITRLIAQELGIDSGEILDFDLTLNEYNKGCIMGMHNEFISSPKLDNLAMTHAGFKAFLNSKPSEATQMLCIFDNEEVGSLTKQGAGSPVFRHLVERIMHQVGKSIEDYYRAVYKSFMISADMAHSIHPNYEEKHDPILHPLMNKGPVIKITANQKYTSDGDSIAVFESICQKAGVPYQKFLNRSDMPGGSTLGNVSTGQLDIRSVDIGNAMLGMHSVRELAGVTDHEYLIRAMQTFYEL